MNDHICGTCELTYSETCDLVNCPMRYDKPEEKRCSYCGLTPQARDPELCMFAQCPTHYPAQYPPKGTAAPGTEPKTVLRPAVGDTTSAARGTGARYNADKPRTELLDLYAVALSTEPPEHAQPESVALFALAEWQASGGKHDDSLYDAMGALLEDLGGFWWLEVAKVLGKGAAKYADWNWAKGMSWSVVLGCAVRHILAAFNSKEAIPVDGETGLPHRAHTLCNLMFLSHYLGAYPEGNDLYQGPTEEEYV